MSELRNIPVDQVVPNPEQPRLTFDAGEIESLAQSIKNHGQLHPIVVEEYNGGYVLVDGERRWRAVKLLGWDLIEAKIRTYDEIPGDKFMEAAISNLQRSDLNPIEEGKVFLKLKERRYTLARIAIMAGKSIGHVTTRLKMIEFEPEIQELFAARKLPIDLGVVYNLFKLPDDIRVRMAKRYAANNTTVSGITRSVVRINWARGNEDVSLVKSKVAPAVAMSEEEGEVKLLELLEKDGSLPEWELVKQAAVETCKSCDLYDMASTQMCKDCPAVDLLRRVKKMATQSGGAR